MRRDLAARKMRGLLNSDTWNMHRLVQDTLFDAELQLGELPGDRPLADVTVSRAVAQRVFLCITRLSDLYSAFREWTTCTDSRV